MKKEKRSSYEDWESIFNDFESHYFRLADKVINWYPSGKNEIIIVLDDGCVLRFDWITKYCQNIIESEEDDYMKDEDSWKNNFANRLNQRMKNIFYTQERLAAETGISFVTINKYAKGKSIPSVYNLEKIARALKCSMYELTGNPID